MDLMSRAHKNTSAISAWENSKKAATEAELRKIEVRVCFIISIRKLSVVIVTCSVGTFSKCVHTNFLLGTAIKRFFLSFELKRTTSKQVSTTYPLRN